MTRVRNSIGRKLMQGILLTSGAVLLLTFASYFLYEVYSYREETTRELRILGDVLAFNSTAALAFNSDTEADNILSSLNAGKYISYACLYDERDSLFAKYPKSASAADFPDAVPEDGFRFSGRYVTGVIPVTFEGKRLGTLFLQRTLSDMHTRLSLYTLMGVMIVSAGFFIAFLFSRRLQRRIAIPVVSLSEVSRLVSLNRDYSVRARKFEDDEVGVLTDTFNAMLSQIEVQNAELERAREAALQNAQELEVKVEQRTIEYKRQKDFAEVVVNSSLVLIAVFDRELRILEYNRKCEEEFQIKREDVLGEIFTDKFPLAVGSETHQGLLRALGGEVVHNEQYRSTVTGYYYESYIVPLRNETGEVYAALMTAHNITQIVESTAKLRQTNDELQRRNAELEQFAYVASHDLQEPLRKIRTFIELVKTNSNKPETAHRYLDKIDSSAVRMASLIKAVLEYSRLQRIEESFEEVDLNEILSKVREDFELLITQRGVRLSSDPLPVIKGNKLQLHQLFSNMISNAIKFCDDTPVITIACESIDAQSSGSANGHVRLSFIDNGIGFENQYAEKVFTIFQRLNSHDQYGGTGIGLALCKKIVENHKGSIAVESMPGKGTTFTIVLPTGSGRS